MSESRSRRILKAFIAMAFVAAFAFGAALEAQDMAPTPAQIAMGDSIFNGTQFGACWACHGKQGKGSPAGPKLNDSEWLNVDGSLDAIKGVIKTGVPKPKKAKAPMPAMGGAKLSPEAVDALAAYVYSLTNPAK